MKTLVVAHDAGGAEVLAAYLMDNATDLHMFDVYAEGPAVAIFNRHRVDLLKTKPHIIRNHYSFVLTGTSLGARLENEMIEMALNESVKCASLLDHWLHFSERFCNCGKRVLPDVIWVTDPYSLALARRHFPHTPIELYDNWYWSSVKHAVRAGPQDIWLLALENRSMRGESPEDNLVLAASWAKENSVKKLIVRLHPSMQIGRAHCGLKNIVAQIDFCELSHNDLIGDLSQVGGVIGFQTTVLALAVICEKRAVSLIASIDEQLAIPFAEIELPLRNID